MRRLISLLPIAFLAGACATGPQAMGPNEAIAWAKKEASIRGDARDYSRFAIARYASLTEDPEAAAENYSRIARTSSGDAELMERAVFSALLVGETDHAIKLAKRLPPDTLKNSQLPKLALAVDAMAKIRTPLDQPFVQGSWDNAFHASIAQSMEAWTMLEDRPETAIALHELIAANDPVLSSIARTNAALMKIQVGDLAGAEADLAALWKEHARLATGVEAEARILAVTGRQDLALKRIRDFRKDIGRNPALSVLSQQLENGDEIELPELTPQQGVALYLYTATAALADGTESDLPGVYFALALALDPTLHAARTLWAESLDRAGRRADAIRLLESVPETSLFHTNAQGQLAWVLRREGRNEEALQLAKDTLEQTDDRNIRIQLADLLQSLDRDGEAEAIFTEVIEADEAAGTYDWRIYFARGAARERLGYWPPAENDLKTALGMQPLNPTILNYLGYSWIDRGIHLEEGLELIEKALKLAPRNGAVTDSLGWAHYKLGNYDRAVYYLERATELSPQDAEILDHLGDAYWQVGRYTEAGYQWDRALLYSEDAIHTDLIRKKLNSGAAMVSASDPAALKTP
ncbi:MAG: tetratricopeptide repeat protein [Henriciella sp.]|nr:tetratricopeptide repeat protein [Henriciella sp.]